MNYDQFLARVQRTPSLNLQFDGEDIFTWLPYLDLMDSIVTHPDDHYLSHADSISEGRYFYDLLRHVGKNPDIYLARFMIARRILNLKKRE